MSRTLSEIREAICQLRRHSGFSLAAIALLAAGLGATTAIFSLFNAIILRPLPYRDAARLVGLRALNASKGLSQEGHSAADFRDFADRGKTCASLTAYRPNFAAYTAAGESAAQWVTGLVTESFFDVFGVPPSIGRTPHRDEFSIGAPRSVVLSDACWRRAFHARPEVLGRVIMLDDEPHTIVGVMPPKFREPEFVDAWLPFPSESPEYLARDSRFWSIVGRLKPSLSEIEAQAEFAAISADLARQFPVTNRGWNVAVVPLQDLRTQGLRSALVLLLGAVGLVLTVACLNLANLLLARGIARMPDLAVRLALGATPQSLARSVLWESILLSALGGALGAAISAAALPALAGRLPAGVIPRSHELVVHPMALAVTLVVALVSGALFGVLPALQIARANVSQLLKSGDSRGATGSFGARLQSILVAGQIALSFIVLAASLLLIKSLTTLRSMPTGFDADGVFTVRLAPPPARYETNLDLARYYERVIDEVSRLPGVQAVAVNASAPLCGITLKYPFWIMGRPRNEVGADEAVYAPISEDYFATLRMPLRSGRTFKRTDDESAAAVAMINETLAKRMFPGEDPLGKRVLLLPWLSNQWREIVGIVGDSRQDSLAEDAPPQIYVPQRQMPWFFSTLLVRTVHPSAAAGLPAALRRADPTLPFTLRSLDDHITLTATQPRLVSWIFGVFATAALGLAAFGLYASLRFTFVRRTREIGIRMALGATPASVRWLVLKHAAQLAGWGLAVGLLGALALSGLLRGLLFGVQPTDPSILGALLAFIPFVAACAALPTALRVARTSAITALQHE